MFFERRLMSIREYRIGESPPDGLMKQHKISPLELSENQSLAIA